MSNIVITKQKISYTIGYEVLYWIELNWVELSEWVNDCRHADIWASGELNWQPMSFEEEPASQLDEVDGMGIDNRNRQHL